MTNYISRLLTNKNTIKTEWSPVIKLYSLKLNFSGFPIFKKIS